MPCNIRQIELNSGNGRQLLCKYFQKPYGTPESGELPGVRVHNPGTRSYDQSGPRFVRDRS